MARDIKNLKLDLLSSFPRARKVSQSSEEVESRLVTEAINEVASLDPVVNGVEEFPDIMQELTRRNLADLNTFEPAIECNAQSILPEVLNPEVAANTVKNFSAKVGTFASRLERSASQQRSQSLLREQTAVEENPGPRDIYMREAPRSSLNLHGVNEGEDFGEIDGDQLAALGLFAKDYSLGKRLYDRLLVPETLISNEVAPPVPVRVSEIEVPGRMNSIDCNARDMDINNLATAFSAPFGPSQIHEDDPAVPTGQPSTSLAVPLKEKTIHDIEEKLQNLLTTPSQSTQARAIIPDAITSPARPSGTSRSDYFRKIIDEIGQQVLTKRKPRRKQRQQQSVDNDVAEMNKPVVKRKHKSKVARLRLPELKLKIITDIYDGLDDYEDDLPEEWYEDELMVENDIVNQPIVAPLRQNETPIVDAPALFREETAAAQQTDDIRFSSSDMAPPLAPIVQATHVTKQPRFSLNDQPVELDSFSFNLHNTYKTPSTPAFRPQHTSTAASKFLPHDLRLTGNEIEYARLQFISERNLSEIIIAQTGAESQRDMENRSTADVPAVGGGEAAPKPVNTTTSKPDKSVSTSRPEYAKNGERHLRRYEFEGEQMVEFLGVKSSGSLSSRLERHSEYLLEVSKITQTVLNHLTF